MGGLVSKQVVGLANSPADGVVDVALVGGLADGLADVTRHSSGLGLLSQFSLKECAPR